jgi:MFS family permease
VAFSCAGHFFNHFFEPTFFVVALVLPSVFGISYEAALALIIIGKVLLGVMAPVAGWIADRWSAPGMMAVYFLGMGAAGIGCGLVDSAWEMGVALTVLGALLRSIIRSGSPGWCARRRARGRRWELTAFLAAWGQRWPVFLRAR